MNAQQITLFVILAVFLGLLLWGRWRYDIVAFAALIAAVLVGVVPSHDAFTGFGHPATVVVAIVLIVGRGLMQSGVVELLARKFIRPDRSLFAHISIMSGLVAALSAFMNNVAALALMMPLDIEAARQAKRSPALTLMPLSFASILGGLVTLVGTPPNIVIANFRAEKLGSPFGMFDFTPVGLTAAVVGVIFVAVAGWRLIPRERGKHNITEELKTPRDYVAELKVGPDIRLVGMKVSDFRDEAERAEVEILTVLRNGRPLLRAVSYIVIEANDILVVQAGPKAIEQFAGVHALELVDAAQGPGALEGSDLEFMEVVVPQGAAIEERSALSLGLLARHGVCLVGISRQGKRFRERVRQLTVRSGDVLLLLGSRTNLEESVTYLGCLPLAEDGIRVVHRDKAILAIGIFASAIIVASLGLIYLPLALAIVVIAYLALGVIRPRELYDSVEWPVIVLLGSIIPIGTALETSGGSALIAEQIIKISDGYSPSVVLVVIMVLTMMLSDVMNNTATAIIAAPIALDVANHLGVSPDPFLMAVAVASSCAFLTPIGHKNNILVMGPGGYAFGDYWRMGLPLEILIMAVSVPMILLVWHF